MVSFAPRREGPLLGSDVPENGRERQLSHYLLLEHEPL